VQAKISLIKSLNSGVDLTLVFGQVKQIAIDFVTCSSAMLGTGIVFGGICLSVRLFFCPHIISKTTGQKLMKLGRNMFHDEH